MGQAKRQSPGGMPTAQQVSRIAKQLTVPYVVTGSRDTTSSKSPDYEVHGTYRVSGPDNLASVKDTKVIIFIHGYNVTPRDALESSLAFFSKIKLSEAELEDNSYTFILFTWPGDTGVLYLNRAQEFAQHSGVALYWLIQDLKLSKGAKSVTVFTHSLGAHVALRCASVIGDRMASGRSVARIDSLLLMAPAVEDDVFERPGTSEEYHFPDSPFGIRRLHILASRGDLALKTGFVVNEGDHALGYAGPESMSPLKTMTERVPDVLGRKHPNLPMEDISFVFQLHDLSPKSTSIMNPDLMVNDHSDYWTRDVQLQYMMNFVG